MKDFKEEAAWETEEQMDLGKIGAVFSILHQKLHWDVIAPFLHFFSRLYWHLFPGTTDANSSLPFAQDDLARTNKELKQLPMYKARELQEPDLLIQRHADFQYPVCWT